LSRKKLPDDHKDQVLFKLYGIEQSKKEMLEWLGTSYEDMILEFPDQKLVA
jgi:hypothetical protein